MIPFEEAYDLVMKHVTPAGTERVNMPESQDRILAEDIFSDIDMPPFNKSAVDGFACRMEDLDKDLEVIETIPAGKTPEFIVSSGTCSRIMTGAMIPEGTDCVIMVEETKILENGKMRCSIRQTSPNICFQGEDIKAGDLVLPKGTLIKPQHIAVLAAAGAVNPKVSVRVHVGILSTGDELVEPEHIPAPSKIRNTNAFQLAAQVSDAGAIPQYGGIAADTEISLSAMISDSLDRNDLVLLTGGVSMGDFDYVPKVMKELDIELIFKSVAIQPGRPTVFGKRGNQFVFGLPGNPVSSFVLFEVLVKPFLLKMMGYENGPEILHLPLGTDFRRNKSTRKSLIPVRIENGMVFPVEYHGSAHINAFTRANGILTIEIGRTEMLKGEIADVRSL
ncbi:MAG: molybdopterin molybdotransferase MoeA [Bacteroidetes bacterium]|nr:molybdopterin molybdotransferase MoeA [Bacteroidota bacterium]